MDQNTIELNHVSKIFRVYQERTSSIFSLLLNKSKKEKFYDIPILDDVSFSVKSGEMLGIIGRNGVGKTTLLKLIAKIYRVNSGEILTRGTIVPLLNLGIGFHPDQTARNNIMLYSKILGLSDNEIKQKIDMIIEFAEVEKFIDAPIRNFSRGMMAKLAFATAMQVNPDILLVDEILSVGDTKFQKKSFEAFQSFKNNKKTIVFVSHNMNAVKKLCDRVICLEKGKIKFNGNSDEAIEVYDNLDNN